MNWPNLGGGGQRFEAGGPVGATSAIASVTSGAANVKGTYVELIAATAFHAAGVLLSIHDNSGAGSFLVDIAIGAAGSEQPVVSNMLVAGGGVNAVSVRPFLPIEIKAGSRVAARIQGNVGSPQSLQIAVHLIAQGFEPIGGGVVTAYGVDTATSLGTGLDPGATINTKGAWSQLTASCGGMRAGLLAITSKANLAPANAKWLIEIGIGPAASELALMADVPFFTTTIVRTNNCVTWGWFPFEVPAGKRLAARCQCSINDATDRLIDMALYGVG